MDDSIYGDIGEYKPTRRYDQGASSSKADDGQNKHRYFDKPSEQEEREAIGAIQSKLRKFLVMKQENERESELSSLLIFFFCYTVPAPPKLSAQLITKLTAEPEGYAECYPGLQEMNDAIDDSDDEVDYTKMDLGNKKGPIGRWDFDTQEEYSGKIDS